MTQSLGLKVLFGNVLEMPASERASYLDVACAGDIALRAELEELLHLHQQAGSFLMQGMPGGSTPFPDTFDNPVTQSWGGQKLIGTAALLVAGTMLSGRYQLVELIGEGGMGSVWLAKQTEPIRRQVAVKLVKDGMDSRHVLARFEAERQALAMMDHPNIARVLDAGATAEGRPFFVMELVNGIPITKFCDQEKLSPRERLSLFVPVCQAIQHAHQKGIIHRDIKPSNVLVAIYDGKPVPKVIDFGVAKATGPMLTEMTLNTGLSIIGTPEYMAPEQISQDRVDVDTRTDVYGLGALLYELLTGTPPFTRRELQGSGLLDILQAVREQEPAKPSTRLSCSATLETIADHRGMEPRKLTRLVRGDLDWIVMRTLEKDRNRRYETANGLGRDVERYLAGEPVLAVPPSSWYRTRKFVQRNRGVVAATALLMLALTAGITGTTIGLFRADSAMQQMYFQAMAVSMERDAKEAALTEVTKQKSAALQERDDKEKARKAEADERIRTETERKRADVESEIARTVNAFLQELLGQADIVVQADQGYIPNPNLTVREVLDRAAKTAGERFHNRPPVEAAVHLTLADAYFSISEFEKALAQFKIADRLVAQLSGKDSPEHLTLQRRLARTYRALGRRAEALRVFQHVLFVREKTLKVTDPLLLQLFLQSLKDLAGCLSAYSDGPKRLDLLKRIHTLRVNTLGPNALETRQAEFDLVWAQPDQNRVTALIPALERIRATRMAQLIPGHPEILLADEQLAAAYLFVGRTQDAITLLTNTVETIKENMGENHRLLLFWLESLAYAHHQAAQFQEVVKDRKWIVQISERTFGANHQQTVYNLFTLAKAYRNAGQSEKSIEAYEDLLKKARTVFGPYGHKTREVLDDLINTFKGPDHEKRRAELLEELNTAWRSEAQAKELEATGRKLLVKGSASEAQAQFERLVLLREKAEPNTWRRYDAVALVGLAFLKQQKYSQAEKALLEGYWGVKEREAHADPIMPRGRLSEIAGYLIQLYKAWGKPDELAKWRDEYAKFAEVEIDLARPVQK